MKIREIPLEDWALEEDDCPTREDIMTQEDWEGAQEISIDETYPLGFCPSCGTGLWFNLGERQDPKPVQKAIRAIKYREDGSHIRDRKAVIKAMGGTIWCLFCKSDVSG